MASSDGNDVVTKTMLNKAVDAILEGMVQQGSGYPAPVCSPWLLSLYFAGWAAQGIVAGKIDCSIYNPAEYNFQTLEVLL